MVNAVSKITVIRLNIKSLYTRVSNYLPKSI
jgi:hypothetical protein